MKITFFHQQILCFITICVTSISQLKFVTLSTTLRGIINLAEIVRIYFSYS